MSENENQEESSVVRELRQKVKEQAERLSTLEPIARQSAFKEAGIDVSTGPGKFFAEKYDGELTADAIKEAAEPYGFVSTDNADAPAQQEDGTQQRVTDLRQQSTPDNAGKRYSFSEFQQLSKADPPAAKAAHAAGLVDFPPHMAPDLAASSG